MSRKLSDNEIFSAVYGSPKLVSSLISDRYVCAKFPLGPDLYGFGGLVMG